MKKVLIAAPYDSSFRLPIKHGFEKLGYKAKEVDYRFLKGNLKFNKDFFQIFLSSIITIILNIYNKKLGQKYQNEKINLFIIDFTIKFKPDIFFVVKGEKLSKDCINKIKKLGVKTVNWFPDPMNLWNLMIRQAIFYDYFLHFDPLVVKKLRSKGFKNIYYLPFAAEINPGKKAQKTYDISFIGTYSKYREDILSNLMNFNLSIWGDQRWYKSRLRLFVRGGRISHTKMKNIIKMTKVNINLIYDAPKKGTNLRTFEVTGCGSFLLCEYVEDLKNLFEIDKEIVLFKTMNELKKKSRYFLNNNVKREIIAKAGFKRSNRDHNYKKRMIQMLNIISVS